MNRALVRALALTAFVPMAITSVPADAQTIAPAPYYATPSWDQMLPPKPRFIVLSNWNGEAVLDKETGLVWERSPSVDSVANWFVALSNCRNKTVANRKGWRLPTLQELSSLVDPSKSDPSLPTGHPFTNVQSNEYWSASSRAVDTDYAYSVDFENGDATDGDNKTLQAGFNVWCVRGGNGVDPQ